MPWTRVVLCNFNGGGRRRGKQSCRAQTPCLNRRWQSQPGRRGRVGRRRATTLSGREGLWMGKYGCRLQREDCWAGRQSDRDRSQRSTSAAYATKGQLSVVRATSYGRRAAETIDAGLALNPAQRSCMAPVEPAKSKPGSSRRQNPTYCTPSNSALAIRVWAFGLTNWPRPI